MMVIGNASGGDVCAHTQHVYWSGGCGLPPAGHQSLPTAWQSCVWCSSAHSPQQRHSVSRNKVSRQFFCVIVIVTVPQAGKAFEESALSG